MAKVATVNNVQPLTLPSPAAPAAEHHLDLWQHVEKTDPAYTKPFSRAGGFHGTAINATYLAQRATEVFGPIGIGWGMEILDEALLEGAPLDDRGTRELIHKVRVKLWYKLGESRGEVIHFGQTVFVGSNRYGLFTDEEAPKKSLTDGMSKCLSLLGFSADIHLGRYDDNKYLQDVTAEFEEKRRVEAQKAATPISQDQADDLADLIGETGTDLPKFCEFFNIEKLADMPAQAYDRAVRMLKKKKALAV